MKLQRLPRALGLDTNRYISPQVAAALRESGYRWVARYISRHHNVRNAPDRGSTDTQLLSRDELVELLAAGLLVAPIQFGSRSAPTTGDEGARAGEAARWCADQMGLPEGTTIWCDHEPELVASPESTAECLRRWAAELAPKYRAGLYVSPEVCLTAEQLYQLPGFTAYWMAASMVPIVATRGPCIHQGLPTIVHGLPCDQDMGRMDQLGDRPMLLAA